MFDVKIHNPVNVGGKNNYCALVSFEALPYGSTAVDCSTENCLVVAVAQPLISSDDSSH